MLIMDQRLRRSPRDVIHIVDRAFDGREGAAFLRQLDTGLHGMITDKLHHLRAELLPFLRSIAHADVIHQVGQAHDAQPDAAGFVRGFVQLRDGRHIGIGFHHIIQEARRGCHALAKLFPIHGSIGAAMLIARLTEPRQQFS